MFIFSTENSLIFQNQSGFKPGDSSANQLLSITHQIYKPFDDGHKVRFVFLDMFKAFVKVWHKGPIFKLKQNGVSGNHLSTLTTFLRFRKQRVVLIGQLSSWSNIEVCVPQGSVFGPLLTHIYVSDLSDGLRINTRLFAGNASLFQ